MFGFEKITSYIESVKERSIKDANLKENVQLKDEINKDFLNKVSIETTEKKAKLNQQKEGDANKMEDDMAA